jgi:molecular chaperone DnaJ
MSKRDFYKLLELTDEDKKLADNDFKDKLKKNYRRLSKIHHPDKGGDETLFKEISEAYEVLSDNEKKSRYDTFGHADDNRGSYDDMHSGFRDMFGNFFRQGQQQRERVGENMTLRIKLTLEEIFEGVKKKYNYTRNVSCSSCSGHGGTEPQECPTCKGQGQIRHVTRTPFGFMEQISDCDTCSGTGTTFKNECNTCKGSGLIKQQETIEVDIPTGVQEGMAFVMAGKGNGIRSGKEGDLIIKILEHPHERFTRVGSDLKQKLKLQYHQLVLGDKVEINTIEGGTIRIPISEYSQVGHNLRIPYKGLRELNTDKRGDLIVTLGIDMPTKLNDDVKAAIIDLKLAHEKNNVENL